MVDGFEELFLGGLSYAEQGVDGVEGGADKNVLRERGDVVALDDFVPQLHVHQRPLLHFFLGWF